MPKTASLATNGLKSFKKMGVFHQSPQASPSESSLWAEISAHQQNRPTQVLNTQQLSCCCCPHLAGTPNPAGQGGIAQTPQPRRLQDAPRDGTGSATSMSYISCPGWRVKRILPREQGSAVVPGGFPHHLHPPMSFCHLTSTLEKGACVPFTPGYAALLQGEIFGMFRMKRDMEKGYSEAEEGRNVMAEMLGSCSLSASENRDLCTAFPRFSPDLVNTSAEPQPLAGASANTTAFLGFWIRSRSKIFHSRGLRK